MGDKPELMEIWRQDKLTPHWGQPKNPDRKKNRKQYPTAEELRDWIPTGKFHAQPIRIITNDCMGITLDTFNVLVLKLRDQGELICIVDNDGVKEVYRAENYDEFLEWKNENAKYQAEKAKKRKDAKEVYG